MAAAADTVVVEGIEYWTIPYFSKVYDIPVPSVRTIIRSCKVREIGRLFGVSRLLSKEDMEYILSRRGALGKRANAEESSNPKAVYRREYRARKKAEGK